MQVRTNNWVGSFLLLIIAMGCKEPFDANIAGEETGFLVVEGYINVGNDAVSTIKLSRTTDVSESMQQVRESNAVIAIEDEQGNQFFLEESEEGIYTSEKLSLSIEQKFRISILTAAKKQYYSRFEQPIVTPAIDSLIWDRVSEGVAINVFTHAPNNNTRYYQWDYEEAWEVKSPFMTHYYYSGGQILLRPLDERDKMSLCWKYDYPNRLLTASTATLSVDAVMKQLVLIPVSDERISSRYAITVRQTALSREHYEYLELMEKNTNEVGTFSDPQPSELYGNIFHESSDEPVIGFIGAYTTSEARIFIKEREVPDWNFNMYCEVTAIPANPDSLKAYLGGSYVPVLIAPEAGIVYISPLHCVDCRSRGGKNIKPDYWD
jgi:hypothetical protein